MPDSWEPLGVAFTELVACVGEEEETRIELCLYNGPNIERFVYQRTVRARSALTGRVVATSTIRGEPPRECRYSEPWSLVRLEGTHPGAAEVTSWLAGYTGGQ
jgi:hypothetical protein